MNAPEGTSVCPSWLYPHAARVPSLRMAIPWESPADTAMNPLPVGTSHWQYSLLPHAARVPLSRMAREKYPSSVENLDGNSWRILLPHEDSERKAIVVDINGIIHDGVHTLGNQIYSTNDVNLDEVNWISNDDHWTRSILWLIEEARILSIYGVDYSEVINKYKLRLEIVKLMHSIKLDLIVEMKELYKTMFGVELILPKVSMALNDWNFTPESVASIMYPSGYLKWAVITVAPKAFSRGMEYVRYVIMHELIHLAIGESDKSSHGHNAKFNMLAEAMGLPKQFRD